MRAALSKDPVARFPLPPEPPSAVAEADARFKRVGREWAEAVGELADAREALAAARAEARRAAAAAIVAEGKAAAGPERRVRTLEKQIAEGEERVESLRLALDELGNMLAAAVAAEAEEWRETLAGAEAEAAQEYDAALERALAALDRIRAARGGVAWLDEFDPGQARAGRVPGFTGGRVAVREFTPGPLRGAHDPRTLLELALALTKPSGSRASSDGFGRTARPRADEEAIRA